MWKDESFVILRQITLHDYIGLFPSTILNSSPTREEIWIVKEEICLVNSVVYCFVKPHLRKVLHVGYVPESFKRLLPGLPLHYTSPIIGQTRFYMCLPAIFVILHYLLLFYPPLTELSQDSGCQLFCLQIVRNIYAPHLTEPADRAKLANRSCAFLNLYILTAEKLFLLPLKIYLKLKP